MSELLIAVAVSDDGNLAPHAGRALQWHVYVVDHNNKQAQWVWAIDLTDTSSLHAWHVRGDGNRHPLHAVDIALAGSAGDGVIRNLGKRQTKLVTTAEKNPLLAVLAYIDGDLPNGLPHETDSCLNPAQHQQRHAFA